MPSLRPTVRLLSLLVLTISAAAAPASGADVQTASTDPGAVGRWSGLQRYPVVPISAAVTPDGKIVAWDQADRDPPHSISPNSGRAMILDPVTGSIRRSINLAPASVFCPLITTLPDGKVVIAGGGNDSTTSDEVILYDPRSRTFGTWSAMSTGRWYPGGTITRHGDIVAVGGRGGTGADVIDAATGVGRRLDVDFGEDWYPLALRMPDGRFTLENVTDLRTSASPTRQILDIGGAGSLTGADDLTLLERRLRMTATMVGPYTLLGIGGGTSRESYLLDVSDGSRPIPRPTGPMRDPHITGTAVTLPDGSALVIGGNSNGSDTYGTPVLGVERWSPHTGQWTPMRDTPRSRQYHSVAALLPDGRVWSAGTSVAGAKVHEYNGAYFSPPYLFRKDGSGRRAPRPQIADAPSSTAWGERLTVRSPQAASIRRASLVRLSATTHQYDFAGTFVPLDVSVDGDAVSVDIPANGNTLPAGPYMLFLVDSAGVPSKAAIVRVDPTSTHPPAATTMMSSLYSSQRPSWKGVDGDASPESSVLTKRETGPWWQVDFGRSRTLTSATFANEIDGPGRGLASAWVFASDEPFTSTSTSATRAQRGVTAVQLPASVGDSITVPFNRTARYLRVQLPRTDHLHFRELSLNGATPPPPPPSILPGPAAGGWTLNGASTIAGQELQLTPASEDVRGSAFHPEPLTVGDGLTVEFDATAEGGSGADGLALVVGDPDRGATPSSLGAGGGALGFGGIPGWAVGLTTYPESRLGISDGPLPDAWQTLRWTGVRPLPALQNMTRRVRVELTPTAITASVDGGPALTQAAALPGRVLLGFSAATGGLTNRHAVSRVRAYRHP